MLDDKNLMSNETTLDALACQVCNRDCGVLAALFRFCGPGWFGEVIVLKTTWRSSSHENEVWL